MSTSEIEVKVFPTDDPRLDWVSMHDPRSLNFSVREEIREVEVRPRRWATGVVLNQGREGACVGYGWTAEMMASPRPDRTATVDIGTRYAITHYREAQVIDEWPGENYEGTSVLAGAKVAASRGLIDSYRWAFSIEDVRDAVISEGPVVIGIPWYEDMYDTRGSGLVEVGGPMVGGHCLTLTEYHPGKRLRGEDWDDRFHGFTWQNSWGRSYGVNGFGFVRFEDLRDLLAGWGEACVPMGRKLVRLSRALNGLTA